MVERFATFHHYYHQGELRLFKLITADMEHLLIAVCAPKGLLREVKKVIYADTRMTKDLEVLRESIAPVPDSTGEKFVFDIQKPNLMYGYAIEWIFGEPNDPTLQLMSGLP